MYKFARTQNCNSTTRFALIRYYRVVVESWEYIEFRRNRNTVIWFYFHFDRVILMFANLHPSTVENYISGGFAMPYYSTAITLQCRDRAANGENYVCAVCEDCVLWFFSSNSHPFAKMANRRCDIKRAAENGKGSPLKCHTCLRTCSSTIFHTLCNKI